MNQLSKHATNADLQNHFGATLADGQTRVFAIEQSRNPEYKTVYMCQVVKKPGGDVGSTQKFFLGWDDTRILRVIHNSKADVLEARGIKVGTVVPFDIHSEEKTFPAYEGQEPRVNPKTAEVIMFQGQAVYEHTELVSPGFGGIKQLARQEANIIRPASEVFEAAKVAAEAAKADTAKF